MRSTVPVNCRFTEIDLPRHNLHNYIIEEPTLGTLGYHFWYRNNWIRCFQSEFHVFFGGKFSNHPTFVTPPHRQRFTQPAKIFDLAPNAFRLETLSFCLKIFFWGVLNHVMILLIGKIVFYLKWRIYCYIDTYDISQSPTNMLLYCSMRSRPWAIVFGEFMTISCNIQCHYVWV